MPPGLQQIPGTSASPSLSDILAYHVIPGEVIRSRDLSNEQLLATSSGADMRINVYPNGVTTAQCAPLHHHFLDQTATNGVLHVLKEVALPPAGNIMDVVSGTADLASLLFALMASSLSKYKRVH